MTSSYDAIRDEMLAYTRAQDAGDWAGVGRIFAYGTFQSSRGEPLGGDVLVADRERRIILHDGSPRTKHITSNVMIEVDEEAGTAHARSYIVALQQTERLPLQPIFAGRYHDAFERLDGRWRFRTRRVLGDLSGDMREHVGRPPPGHIASPAAPSPEELPLIRQSADSAEAIHTVIFTYAERHDLADYEVVGRLFAHGWRSLPGGVRLGGDALAAAISGGVRRYDGSPRTKHVTTNVLLDIDEARDAARAQSYFVVYQATEELPLQAICAGRYFDRFERVDDGWRFAERDIRLDLRGNLSGHAAGRR